jgi:hypothetical protein
LAPVGCHDASAGCAEAKRRRAKKVGDGTTLGPARYLLGDPGESEENPRMPEASRPSPSDRSVSRNLFLDADPDLDALAQPTADGRPRAAGRGQRRRHGLVVLAEQDRLPERMRAHDADRFTRPNGNATRLRRATRHALRQADAAAGRLLSGLAAKPNRALVTIVALGLALVVFAWRALEIPGTSTARAPADGRPARNAATLRDEEARITALTAELHQLEQSAPTTAASSPPATGPDVHRQPPTPNPAGPGPHGHR